MKPLHRFARPLTGTLTALLLCTAPAAQAAGRWADIQVMDRDSGQHLPIHAHASGLWVQARAGARYALSMRNTSGERLLTVVSVDGVNVISGQTASWEQSGYVLSPGQPYAVTGWRKSDEEVAGFHFTALPDAYASRTGRPDHVGVIGVAVFREQAAEPAPVAPHSQRQELSEAERAQLEKSAASPAPAAAPAAASDAASDAAAGTSLAAQERVQDRARAQISAQRLGTGHGQREVAPTRHTHFQRRSSRPDELIRIRYDSRENLIARGIIAPPVSWPTPQPFPAAPRPLHYAPDPA